MIKDSAIDSMEDETGSWLGRYIEKKIPEIEERRKLARMNQDSVEKIKKAMHYFNQDPGSYYLRISHGIVHDRDIDEIDPEMCNSEYFYWLIHERGLNIWASHTRLEEGLFLPSQDDLCFAFSNRIFLSSLLIVDCRGSPRLYPEIERLSKLIYTNLRISHIEKLIDVSEYFEAKTAKKIIRKYIENKEVTNPAGEVEEAYSLLGCPKDRKLQINLDYPFSDN